MTDIANMTPVAQASKIDGSKAAAKVHSANGSALATQVVKFVNGEVQAEQKRSESRMRFVRSILALETEGHSEFRKQLQHELTFLTETMTAAVASGAIKEDESRHGGYSAASFRVMVSNFRTISVAAELGWTPEGEGQSWEDSLSQCRDFKKAQASNGVNVVVPGGRKAGAGRKAASDLAKVQGAVSKLGRKDKMVLLASLAAELKMQFKTESNTPVEATI